VPVFAAVTGDTTRPRRHGLVCSRLVERQKPVLRHGLPVECAEEILLRAARDLALLDLLILLESALRLGHLDRRRMEALLESRRPGVRMLREAWRRATGKSDSGGETVLQAFHLVMDVPFRPQAELFDDHGQLVAKADIHVLGTNFLHEYDGEHHRRKDQQKVDLRRERGLASSSYVRKGFVLDDLLNHPAVVMHEIDNALDRPHDLRRLRRWRHLVDNSFYSDVGRDRIMNRWRRLSGIIDWAGSA
jgi:very-short-patch-repair endonuclease